MARRSRTGGKRGAPTRRKASVIEGRKPAKGSAKPTTIRSNRATVLGLSKELKEAREQQLATSEVLEAINQSGFDLDTILQTVVSTAARLCKTGPADIFLLEGDVYKFRAGQNLTAAYREHEKRAEIRAGPGTLVGRVALEKGVVYIVDALEDVEYEDKEAASTNNFRSMLGVPLLRDGEPIGVFALARTHVEPFSESQIRLVSTFASQAVIAIENARLFDEVRAKTRDVEEALRYQTGSANILSVIASSPTDVQPVLTAIVESVCKLCNAYDAGVLLKFGNDLVYSAHHGPIPIGLDKNPISRNWVVGRCVVDKATLQVSNLLSAEGDDFPEGRNHARRQGHRCVLAAPLIREDEAIGAIALRRLEPVPFNDKQVAQLQTFADQAVIAISNVRLFEQVQQRTRELSKSLDDLRAAQDRLIQTEKLASLGQLTAGIAHEIKNPLNFVNNFSALSVELVDELNDVLRQVELVETVRKETDELTGMLKDNLSKIVQHGKRADSIVKNMLLHSREGSREQRPADVNALVEESLNLAYHGARAEKSGFEITLQRDLDANAGIVEVFPQEVSRALLNLISNGFYAATKRKTENDGAGFEPILLATTKDLGSSVEIRIRDNGSGIPSEIKEKMFNPFFTTKPTGEGTGLGLSMTHDIIVKQHGGRIDVETRLGEFTEFIITLPRNHRRAAGQ
jgi:signal transduction histidine kinase/putative methionine-R-sulfoxide reductase with GAF domain